MRPTEKEIEQKAKMFSSTKDKQFSYIFGYKDAVDDLSSNVQQWINSMKIINPVSSAAFRENALLKKLEVLIHEIK